MSDSLPIIASALLQKKNSENHRIWFNADLLQVFYRGRLRVFEMEQISRISFNHRKLMLPVILGGTVACLSLVAIFKTFYDPWLMLTLLCTGCLSAYFGYTGRWVLTIEESKNYSDFFLKSVTPELKAFVAYANTFTGRQPKGVLYLPVPFSVWERARETGSLSFPEAERLYFLKELHTIQKEGTVILPVPSLSDYIFISWKKGEEPGEDLHPYLEKKSKLPLEQIKPLFKN